MKTTVILALLAAAGVPAAWLALPQPEPAPGPETVRVEAGGIAYQPIGNFHRGGKTVTVAAAPREVAGFDIMKRQVSRADYAACVADGGCKPSAAAGADTGTGMAAGVQTHVSWHDATDYAAWLSEQTGQGWRLPQDDEWQLAAAELFGGAALDAGSGDPAQRWLDQYARGVSLRALPGGRQDARGGGGNSRGLLGMGGNVWEWTNGCMQNGEVTGDGTVVFGAPYCSARIAAGRHRAVVIDFIRDASVGGCAVGLPPDYLGFRLVRAE